MNGLSHNDVLRLLGGSADDVGQDLAEFSQAARILSSDRPRLIDEHPEEWVGVHDNRSPVTAKSFDELMSELKNSGISPEMTIVRYINKEEKTFLF